jgi:hypothetical protein
MVLEDKVANGPHLHRIGGKHLGRRNHLVRGNHRVGRHNHRVARRGES